MSPGQRQAATDVHVVVDGPIFPGVALGPEIQVCVEGDFALLYGLAPVLVLRHSLITVPVAVDVGGGVPPRRVPTVNMEIPIGVFHAVLVGVQRHPEGSALRPIVVDVGRRVPIGPVVAQVEAPTEGATSAEAGRVGRGHETEHDNEHEHRQHSNRRFHLCISFWAFRH